MKKYLKILILILLLLTPKVSAKEISNKEFMKEFKIGWNLGNDLDSYYGKWNGNPNLNQETIWGQPKATQEIIDFVLDNGINVIRIPVTWHNHTYKDENGTYHIYKEWLNRVKEVVDYAYNRNAYVIINTHHDDDYIYLTNNNDDFNNNVIPYVTSIWTEIADYFKDYDEHLLFESYNEIFEVTAGMYYTDIGANQMNILNQLFVNIVRNTGNNNKSRLLMIPTLAHGTSQSTFENFKVPTDITDNKLILTVHFYSNALDQDIETKFTQMKKYADKLNLPLVIDEYGTQVSQEKRIEKISNYTARAYKLGIRTIIWDNGSDFMIFNRSNLLSSKYDVINALTNPHEYNTKNKISLSNYENDWVFARADNNGDINPNNHPEWWGTILTKRKESIPDNAEYLTLLLKNDNDSRGLAIHQIYFYDKDNNYLSSISSNYPGYTLSTFKIPNGASNFKLSIYDAKVNTNKNLFISNFNSGDLSLIYGFISSDLFAIGNKVVLDGTNNQSEQQSNNNDYNDVNNHDSDVESSSNNANHNSDVQSNNNDVNINDSDVESSNNNTNHNNDVQSNNNDVNINDSDVKSSSNNANHNNPVQSNNNDVNINNSDVENSSNNANHNDDIQSNNNDVNINDNDVKSSSNNANHNGDIQSNNNEVNINNSDVENSSNYTNYYNNNSKNNVNSKVLIFIIIIIIGIIIIL